MDLEEKITGFHGFVVNSRKRGNCELVNIGSMDEAPFWFGMPSTRTVSARGEKTVSIVTPGYLKSPFTVFFAPLLTERSVSP